MPASRAPPLTPIPPEKKTCRELISGKLSKKFFFLINYFFPALFCPVEENPSAIFARPRKGKNAQKEKFRVINLTGITGRRGTRTGKGPRGGGGSVNVVGQTDLKMNKIYV